MAWRMAAAAALGLLVCAAMVAGEMIAGHGDLALQDAKGALLLGPLGLLGCDTFLPTFCCLGAVGLLFSKRPRKGETKCAEQTKSSVCYEPRREEELPAVADSPQQSQRSRARKEFRGCLMCGFLEDWLTPADADDDADFETKEPFTSHEDGSEAERRAIDTLRSRLSDLLGAPGSKDRAPCQHAADTVARFGGERSCLYRFLKAKGLDVNKAEKKLRKTVAWRQEVLANSIHQQPEALRIFDLMKPHWPEKIIGTTKQGSPISYFDLAAAVRTCQLDIWTEKNVQSFYVSWMEHSLQLQREGRDRCGPLGAGNNMPPSVVVYNLKDLKLSHVMNCVSGLKAFVKILGIIEEHYPENLHRAVIINVPCIFYRCVWPLVQKSLDQNTQNNIRLSEDEGRDVLQEVLDISSAEVDSLLQGVLC
eukprot:gb/GFBE01061038.1/.p1 GENE.gb/GFBE01061038.1/~~gb/GFBE01061038.1/.p1  ORF type:complete len:421 (+),score=97.39 gb/GFBE01061038.1/:1-1263(+)